MIKQCRILVAIALMTAVIVSIIRQQPKAMQSAETAPPAEELDHVVFDEWFCDTTLRLDYIFAGNSKEQFIYLDKLNRYPRWAGRQQRLNELPLIGNGQIIVRDAATSATIYMTLSLIHI